MALHDFWCQVCGQVLVDIDVPISIGARAGAPPHCGEPTRWIPQVGRMDGANGPGFEAFDAYDGQNRPVTVDSLKKLRDIERQSEVDARNGEGQPIVWRRYSQDASNRHTHTLAPGIFTSMSKHEMTTKTRNVATKGSARNDANLSSQSGPASRTSLMLRP